MLAPILLALAQGCLSNPEAAPLERGLHQRVLTARGPVHLWCPTDGEPELLLVYVHGYFDSVDDAFAEHGLVRQVSGSGVRALLVMIEAPTGPREAVRWETFSALESTVRPLVSSWPRRVVAMGHSGGNRTLRAWTKEGRVTDLVLLDAFYGDPSPWTRFLQDVPSGRLELVGVLTFGKAEAWQRSLAPALKARVQQRRADTNHMGVVTDGVWLPKLLRERSERTGT